MDTISIKLLFLLFTIELSCITMAMEKELPADILEIKTLCLEKGKEWFFKGNLDELDPLVGDTACQIRAIQLALLWQKLKNEGFESFSLTESDKELLTFCTMFTLTKKIEISPSRFIKEMTDLSNLNKELKTSLSGKKLKNFINGELKIAFTENSVKFIKDSAESIGKDSAESIGDAELAKASKYIETVERLTSCPCYISIKTMFKLAHKHKIPIVVKIMHYCTQCTDKIHKEIFLYQFKDATLELVEPKELSLGQAVIVIEGYSAETLIDHKTKKEISYSSCSEAESYYLRFKKYNIMDILLASSATHPQFIGKETPFDEAKLYGLKFEFIKMKVFGKKHGCTKENPFLYMIDHIFCSTLKKALELT